MLLAVLLETVLAEDLLCPGFKDKNQWVDFALLACLLLGGVVLGVSCR